MPLVIHNNLYHNAQIHSLTIPAKNYIYPYLGCIYEWLQQSLCDFAVTIRAKKRFTGVKYRLAKTAGIWTRHPKKIKKAIISTPVIRSAYLSCIVYRFPENSFFASRLHTIVPIMQSLLIKADITSQFYIRNPISNRIHGNTQHNSEQQHHEKHHDNDGMHVTRFIKCRQKQREKQGDDHSGQNAPKYQNNQTIQHNTIRAKIPFLLKIIRELCRIQSDN